MGKKISRRSFIRKGSHLGAATVLGPALLARTADETTEEKPAPEPVEIAVVKGEKVIDQTRKAVELLGGMGAFVPKGAKVAILPNVQRNNPGTFTHPDLVRAVIEMCMEAGAKEVNCLTWLPAKVWDGARTGKVVKESGAHLKIVDMKNEELFKPMPVPRGKILKEARIMEIFYENDLFINLPITKDHMGNKFTGTMKNLMGLSSPKTNRTFHTGNFKNDDINHLDQCIADLNTLIKPVLCVVDATEFIITNGPFGPGKLHKPQKVVAGTDRVAIDAYCASLWGLKGEEIIMIREGHALGLGEIDLAKRKIKEVEL